MSKTDIVMYALCLAIVFAAVAATSLVKILIELVVKKCGKTLTTTVKEYIFTPLSVSLAGIGVYMLLRNGYQVQSETFLYLITGLAGTLTTVIYLAVFQPTRKIAVKIIKWIAAKINLKKAAKVIADATVKKDVDIKDIAETVNTDDNSSGTSAEDAFNAAVNALKKK